MTPRQRQERRGPAEHRDDDARYRRPTDRPAEPDRLTIAAHAIAAIDTASFGDSFCAGVIAGLARGQRFVEAFRLGAGPPPPSLDPSGLLKDCEQAATAMRTLPLAAPV